MEREERARLKAIEEARFAAESAELAQLVSAQQEALEEWREEARRKEEVSQCVCVLCVCTCTCESFSIDLAM